MVRLGQVLEEEAAGGGGDGVHARGGERAHAQMQHDASGMQSASGGSGVGGGRERRRRQSASPRDLAALAVDLMQGYGGRGREREGVAEVGV